jgi:hypothetical protein
MAKNPGYKKLTILNDPPPKMSADAKANFRFTECAILCSFYAMYSSIIKDL